MSIILADLDKWFSERPAWLQAAIAKLVQQSSCTDTDIDRFVKLCLQDATGALSKTQISLSHSLFSQYGTSALRLCAISDVSGINALAPRNPLNFGKGNITIVYGNNGSGKSGYVRLLKHICGARDKGSLYGNVYSPSTSDMSATITYELNNVAKSHIWKNDGVCDDLKNVDIFDTSFGRIFVNSEDEVSYEPPLLSFFSLLISVCEEVYKKLNLEIDKHPSKKPSLPTAYIGTPEGNWYNSITTTTTTQDIEKYCSFNKSDELEIQALKERLAEQAPTEKAKQLRKQKQYIDELIKDTQNYINQLSDLNYQKVVAIKKKIKLKQATADLASKKIFSENELEGIGSGIWRDLWEAARNYSITLAYKESEYPNIAEGAKCVLCHQILAQDAKERLNSFENYITGETQKGLADAIAEYEDFVDSIEELPEEVNLITQIDAAGITEEISKQIIEFYTHMVARRALFLCEDPEDLITDIFPSSNWLEKLRTRSSEFETLAVKYDEDAKTDNRSEIEKKLKGLQTIKWLSEQRAAIDGEVIRLKLVKQINNAISLTNTKSLSQKKGELAEILITEAFIQRFKSELKALGASEVKVEFIKSGTKKGRVLHKIQLKGASNNGISDILSEGESRIISIAAFLADVAGKCNHAPFVFDDPISSLDQLYEESVVQRLINLSLDKQVIIFTHRLSLLGTVRHYAEKKCTVDVVSIRAVDWGTGEPASIPLSQGDIKTALNILVNARYVEAKKANEDGNFDFAEIIIKAMCSDFRTLLERSIENDLLCGVVQRFQRPVHTLKLKELVKLKDSDCYFLDSLMTKYSAFEHSQPLELPVDLPKLDDLIDDMNKLKDWREEYTKRI